MWFMLPDLRHECLYDITSYIWRIRQYEVIFPGYLLKEIRPDHFKSIIPCTQFRYISPCKTDRCLRYIGKYDPAVLVPESKRYSYAARTAAHVQNINVMVSVLYKLQCRLNKSLCVHPWNEHIFCGIKIISHEILLTCDILKRNPCAPLFYELHVGFRFIIIHVIFSGHDHIHTVHTRQVLPQYISVYIRIRNITFLQPVPSHSQKFTQLHLYRNPLIFYLALVHGVLVCLPVYNCLHGLYRNCYHVKIRLPCGESLNPHSRN